MKTTFHNKAEILYDIGNYGKTSAKYKNFIRLNKKRFNTVSLAFWLPEYKESELPAEVSNTVNDLWTDVLSFIGVSDTGFDSIEELDSTIDNDKED